MGARGELISDGCTFNLRMKKRLIPIIALILGVSWIALTVIGKGLLPKASLATAWISSFGSSGFLWVVQDLVPEGASREHVEAVLGEPSAVFVSMLDDRRVSLEYADPHGGPDGSIFISLASDGRVIQIVAPSGKVK